MIKDHVNFHFQPLTSRVINVFDKLVCKKKQAVLPDSPKQDNFGHSENNIELFFIQFLIEHVIFIFNHL